MKFIILTSLLFSLSFIAKSQETPQEEIDNDAYYYQENKNDEKVKEQYIRQAGQYLQKHSKQYYLGLGIMGGGYVLTIAAINSENVGLATIGSLAVLGGLVIQIISHKQIGKAGDMLERSTRSLSERFEIIDSSEGMGLGLAYKF